MIKRPDMLAKDSEILTFFIKKSVYKAYFPLYVLCLLLITGCIFHRGYYTTVDANLFYKSPANTITFWGHAACYIDINGIGIVTDPVFVKSLSIWSLWHHRMIPVPPPAAYANTEIILISHAHRDHLSPATLSQFPKTATVLCPEQSVKIIKNLGMNVQEMKPGDTFGFRGGSIVAATAFHPGGRNSIKAKADGCALGFIIHTSGNTLYYSGDTEFFPGLRDIGKKYHPDLALLNISPHLTSIDAIRAFRALGVSKIIPMHFGAYSSPSAAKNLKWRKELKGILGTIFVSLEVGDNYPLLSPDTLIHVLPATK